MLLLALLMVLTDPGGHGPPPIARLTEHGLEMLCRAANGSRALENIQAGQEDFVAEKAGSKQVYYDNVDKDGMLASEGTAKKWRSFVDALRRVRELQAFAGAAGGDWRLGTGLLPGAAETETDSWQGACDSAGDRIRDACGSGDGDEEKQAGGRQACGVRCGARWLHY